MNWRQNELAEYGDEIAWLSDADATAVCGRARPLISKVRYGLDESCFVSIERLDVDPLDNEAPNWLSTKLGPQEIQLILIFDEPDACRVRSRFFLEMWRNLMLPSRDDVVILPVNGDWVLFYSHEDEFEFGRLRHE